MYVNTSKKTEDRKPGGISHLFPVETMGRKEGRPKGGGGEASVTVRVRISQASTLLRSGFVAAAATAVEICGGSDRLAMHGQVRHLAEITIWYVD